MARRARMALGTLTLALALLELGDTGDAAAAAPADRWLAGDPDAMVELSLRAALRGGPDALARTLVIAELADVASEGKAAASLQTIAATRLPVAADARWLGRRLEPEAEAPWPGLDKLPYEDAGDGTGLVRAWAILGPFEDTGGGLERREGPELPEHRFVGADYSWGVYSVTPRRSLIPTVTAHGLPLDLYVYPREESCTYLSTVVGLPTSSAVHLSIATSGSFRAQWDGVDVLGSAEAHRSATVDRAVVSLGSTVGEHLLTLKVCSGARPDDGRVRVRFSDASGQDVTVTSTSELSVLDRVAAQSRNQAPATAHVRQATSLERTVNPALASTAPTPAEVLAAAITLALADSDDQRSLKAPGLLDRLVADPGPGGERLALAGWVSSFGANRSGWLSQGLERARARGDLGSASFAQRALALHRLRSGDGDLAQATAAEAPLAGEEDAHARFVKARLLAQLGGRGAAAAALAQMTALARQRGPATPVAIWRTVAQLAAAGDPSLRLLALQRLAALRPGQRGAGYLGAHAMLGAASQEQIALHELLHQDDSGQLARIGETLLSAGRHRAALQVFELATALGPNLPRAFRGLGAARRALFPAAPQQDDVLDALARALELEPGDAEIAAEKRFRRGEGQDGPKAGADAAYIVPAQELLARAARQPLAEGLFSRTLHWRRVVRMHPDKRVSQLMHYARQIGVEPRTESERYEDLPGGWGTELLLARVHRVDGSLEAPEEEDSSGPMVRWPKLKRGDVVEVAVRTWTPGPVGRRGDAPFYFVDYVGSTQTRPVLYNEVIIDVPSGSPLAFDVIGGEADERREEVREGHTITHLVWNDPPTLPDEPFAPRVSELLPVVVGSAYPSWESFTRWYEGAVEGFSEPDEQIERLAQELTQGKPRREDKVRALFNFVADDIRYVNYVSGEWWLPNRPQHLLARRQGDCDDKALLLISLLSAVGIEATEVLIQTRHTAQRRVMQSSRVAIPMFDHGIVYLPGEDGSAGRFLDATSPESRMGALPAMDSGAMALLLGKDLSMIETPQSRAEDHGVSAKWRLEIEPGGGGKLSAHETHVGDPAFRLRTYLREEDARAQWVEQNLVAGWFPGLEMSLEVSFEGELPSGAAEVRYQASSRSLARREGKELVVSLAPRMPIAGVLAPLLARTLPVELPTAVAPHHRDMTIEVLAPKGYVFADLPPDGLEDGGEFGKASLVLTLSPDKRKVTVERTVALSRSRIAVDEYDRWRHWLQRVDALLQRSVRLVPG